MSLQFIVGNSGSGKTTLLYKDIIKESTGNSDKNYIVLVPEQFTMQTQKDLVMQHPNQGIMNIDVLSFGRLAHRIFEEVGGNDKIILDDVGKNLILRKIAKKYEGKLMAIGNNIKKPGYISEVKSVISEFTQYNVDFEQLELLLSRKDISNSMSYKLQDMKQLYQGFTDYLKGKYITGEELLDVLCNVIEQSDLIKNSVVVLDGFTGFTPVQNKLLQELLKYCDCVIVSVTADIREDVCVYKHPYQLFALSKQMVTSLLGLAKEVNVPIENIIYMKEGSANRYADNQPMRFLEQHLFRHDKAVYKDKQETLTIHSCGNPKAEVNYVAGEIRRLVREKSYRYRDIGVIVTDMDTYADDIDYVFEQYEIPVFMDYKRSVLLNSFVEYVRSLLAMIEENFLYEGVFRFLRTGLSGMGTEDIDSLENYVIALGIKGYKSWQQPWIRRAKGMDDTYLTKVNSVRRFFVEKIDGITKVLKQRKKTVQDITIALYEFLAAEQMQEKMREYELFFQSKQELVLAKEYGQIYGIVVELFEQFVELLGTEAIGLKEYCELLDAGMNEAKIGVIPPTIDQVTAGDIKRTRLDAIKALFIIGTNDCFLPGKLQNEGLLSRRDREFFLKEQINLAPGPKEEAYIQKFYLYLMMTKPKEYLTVVFSKISAEGKALRPAYLVAELRKLFPECGIQQENTQDFGKLELTKETGLLLLTEQIREKKIYKSDAYKELLAWYLKDGQYREEILRLIDASRYRCGFSNLQQETALRMYGDRMNASVTRLENYAACPFQQFATYGLQLNERQEYQFQALDLGNIFHKALEIFSDKVSNSDMGWNNITQEVREQLVGQSVEESIVDYANTVLYSSARNTYIITRLKRMLNRTTWALVKQLAKGDFVPDGYEVGFGHGKIDRIDICEEEEKVFVKVVDYKTGSKSFDITSLYYGLQMQLAVYLEEAMRIEQRKHPGKEIIPAGIFYYQMKDPIVDKMEGIDQIEHAILAELRMDGLVNENEEVISHLDRDLQGNSIVIPVSRNKNAGLSSLSKTASEHEFELMRNHVQMKMEQINTEIRKGNITPSPYELGNHTGCDYCKYRAVCGFDKQVEGYDYRRLSKMKKADVFEKIKGELEHGSSVDKRTETSD